jgi:hypothetical protein
VPLLLEIITRTCFPRLFSPFCLRGKNLASERERETQQKASSSQLQCSLIKRNEKEREKNKIIIIKQPDDGLRCVVVSFGPRPRQEDQQKNRLKSVPRFFLPSFSFLFSISFFFSLNSTYGYHPLRKRERARREEELILWP